MLILETKRLLITEATLEDSEFLYELMNSKNWLDQIGDRGINNLEDSEEYIQKSLIDSYRTNGFGLYKVLLKRTGKSIGISGFVKRDYLDHPDIGFATHPAYERQGYTFEAASQLISYGKKVLQLSPILGITNVKNVASQKLLEKIGLIYQERMLSSSDSGDLLLYST